MAKRLTTKQAADMLGLPVQTLRVFLQNGKFSEFAEAVKSSSKWTYYISGERLQAYLLNSA